MKQLLFLLLFPTYAMAQYPANANQKITLGEQTTADGLVWRGSISDTANLLTNKLDTSVYIVLDTGTRAMWYYRASTTPKWTRLVDSLNNLQGQLSLTTKVTGVLPLANGGTGSATKNFVDLTTNQNLIQGTKYFTDIGTGRMSINNTGTFARLQVQGINDEAIAYFYNANTISKGVYIEGGTDINDYALLVANKVGTRYLTIFGNGETMLNGTTDRGAYNLQVNGTGVWGEGAYVNGSDANIKENIISLDSSLNIVNNLKPVSFNYINKSVNNDTKHLGFIAQDVYQTLENKDYLNSIVRSDGETLSIAYSNLIPLLTKAIQEQQALIKALEQRIINLENK